MLLADRLEQATIDHRLELFAESGERRGVVNNEPSDQTTLDRLLSRSGDPQWSRIDTKRVQSDRCCQQRVLTGAAPNIEHTADEPTLLGKARKCRLRMTD